MGIANPGAVAPFQIAPLMQGFGASIEGADLSDPVHLDALKTAFRDHRLVAVRGQALTKEKMSQKRFSSPSELHHRLCKRHQIYQLQAP